MNSRKLALFTVGITFLTGVFVLIYTEKPFESYEECVNRARLEAAERNLESNNAYVVRRQLIKRCDEEYSVDLPQPLESPEAFGTYTSISAKARFNDRGQLLVDLKNGNHDLIITQIEFRVSVGSSEEHTENSEVVRSGYIRIKPNERARNVVLNTPFQDHEFIEEHGFAFSIEKLRGIQL